MERVGIRSTRASRYDATLLPSIVTWLSETVDATEYSVMENMFSLAPRNDPTPWFPKVWRIVVEFKNPADATAFILRWNGEPVYESISSY